MKVIINNNYYTDSGNFQGKEYLMLITNPFKIKWFTDCGEWFFYIHLGKKFIRFSSAGFITNIRRK